MKSLLFQNVQADLRRKLCYEFPSHLGECLTTRLTKLEVNIQAEMIFIMFQINLVKVLDFVRSERHSVYTQNSFPQITQIIDFKM